MGCSVIPTKSYIEDYDEIIEYLTRSLYSPKAAEKLDAALVNARENLQMNPSMMHISYDPDLAERECREYPVRNYVIVYRIDGEKVYPMRLFHQSQLKVVH